MKRSQYRNREGRLNSSVKEAQEVWARQAKYRQSRAVKLDPRAAQISALTRAYQKAWDTEDPRAGRIKRLRDAVLAGRQVPPAQVRAVIYS